MKIAFNTLTLLALLGNSIVSAADNEVCIDGTDAVPRALAAEPDRLTN